MKQRAKTNTAIDGGDTGYSYDGILKKVRDMTAGADIDMKLAVYDFAIAALGQELAGESGTAIFKSHPPYSHECHIQPAYGKSSSQKNIKFDHINVVSYAWDLTRWGPAATTTLKYGFRQKMDNYTGIYYVELRLLVITNGLHHSTMAKLLQCGSAKAEVVHLAEIFDTVHTDGQQWFEVGKAPIPVNNFRLAAMYTLAQERAKLSSQPGYVPAHDFSVSCDLDANEEEMAKLYNEVNYWKRKCALFEEQLKKLNPSEN